MARSLDCHNFPKLRTYLKFKFKVCEYKYLGLVLNEFLDYKIGVKYLTESALQASIEQINKFKSLKNIGFKTYMNECI